MAARTRAAPNCVYEASFVDHDTPLTANLTLANLPDGGAHLFNGSLVVGAGSATRGGGADSAARVDAPGATVVLTIEAGVTIAFTNAANRVIVNRGAQIMAVGTAAAPITFTSMADVEALASADTADDLAATATDQWAGITINGVALNNACTYTGAASGEPSRPFVTDAPFTLATQPSLATTACSLGTAASGFHGGRSPLTLTAALDFVIIKHVGDAAVGTNRNALHLRSVGSLSRFSNIEVYSVDGSGIRIDGGSADLSQVLVYNAQTHGVHATGGYLGTLDSVLVSQADGAGEACIQVDAGAGGESQAQIDDGMNTRVTARNLTCDVSADNAGGAGVVVTEGARARIQNAIIVGSRVAADDAAANDNDCLEFSGARSIIEVDGVIASCLESSSGGDPIANFFITGTSVGDRAIATDTFAPPTITKLFMDIQFHTAGFANTISPLAGTDPEFVVLSDVGTEEGRALFSLPLSASTVEGTTPTVVVSGATASRTYLGAIAAEHR